MKKTIIILIILFGAFFQLKSQVLNVSEVEQEKNEWCWAGVSACILDYYCTPTAQCLIADYTRNTATWHDFGNADCCLDPNSGCNYWNYNWGEDGSVKDILEHFAAIHSYGVSSSLTKSAITSDIQDNKVFVIRWGWDAGGGHFVVGHGLIGDDLYYMDPRYGEGFKIADYSWVCSGGGHTWTHTNRLSVFPSASNPPQPNIISGNTSVCSGASETYSISSVSGATSYTWTYSGDGTPSGTGTSCTLTPTSNGTLSVTANNSCGSSSVRTASVSVTTVPTPIISLSGNVLQSDITTGNQWYDQNGMISGETNQNFTVTLNGDYYVVITLSSCHSNASNIINVEARNNKIYPNPVSNELIIEIKNNNKIINYEILNSIGQVVFKGNLLEKTTVQTSHFTSGIYLIKLENGEIFEFEKIIKE